MLKGNISKISPLEAKDGPVIEEWRRNTSDKSPYLGLALTHPSIEISDLFKRTSSKSYLIRANSGDVAGLIITDNEKADDRSIALYLDIKDKRYLAEILDAMLTMLDQLFNEKNLYRVFTYIVSFDTDIEQVFIKLNFTKEAALRQHLYGNGAYHDVFVYGLLKDEFKK